LELSPAAVIVPASIQERTGKETRCVALGHLQRGGSPTNMDRALCTFFGAKAVELIAEKRLGQMVAFTGGQVTGVPLSEATGKLRNVPLDAGFVTAARSMGICLGD
jgi:6-phosphofructokinase 1